MSARHVLMNSASLIYDFYSTNTKQIINAKFCLLTELRRAVDLKFRKALGRAVRRLRIQAAITQEDLAFEAGLERSYVSSIELAHKDPSFTTLQKIAAALNHSLLDLFQIYEEELQSTIKQPAPRRGRPTSKRDE